MKRNLFFFSKRIIALYLKAENEKKHGHATERNGATSTEKKQLKKEKTTKIEAE